MQFSAFLIVLVFGLCSFSSANSDTFEQYLDLAKRSSEVKDERMAREDETSKQLSSLSQRYVNHLQKGQNDWVNKEKGHMDNWVTYRKGRRAEVHMV